MQALIMSNETIINSLQRGLTLLGGFTRERSRLKLRELTLDPESAAPIHRALCRLFRLQVLPSDNGLYHLNLI